MEYGQFDKTIKVTICTNKTYIQNISVPKSETPYYVATGIYHTNGILFDMRIDVSFNRQF